MPHPSPTGEQMSFHSAVVLTREASRDIGDPTRSFFEEAPLAIEPPSDLALTDRERTALASCIPEHIIVTGATRSIPQQFEFRGGKPKRNRDLIVSTRYVPESDDAAARITSLPEGRARARVAAATEAKDNLHDRFYAAFFDAGDPGFGRRNKKALERHLRARQLAVSVGVLIATGVDRTIGAPVPPSE